MEISESFLRPVIDALRFVLEAVGALWIAIGAGLAFIQLVGAHLRSATQSFTPIRITFSRYLSLALEFQLASDILTTALVPSWSQVGTLAAIAAIRTALNISLSRELREYEEKRDREKEAVRDASSESRPRS